MGRRAHRPDPASRRQVEAMAAYGVPEADIARVLAIDPKTLRKHYRAELDSLRAAC
jgi:DNA-binding CsgD family transcriptional regulator